MRQTRVDNAPVDSRMDVDDPMEVDGDTMEIDSEDKAHPSKRKPSSTENKVAKKARKKAASPPVSPKNATVLQPIKNQAPRAQPRPNVQPMSGPAQKTLNPVADQKQAHLPAPPGVRVVSFGPLPSAESVTDTQPKLSERNPAPQPKAASKPKPLKQAQRIAGKVKTWSIKARRVFMWLCLLVLALDSQRVWRHALPPRQIAKGGKLMVAEVWIAHLEENFNTFLDPAEFRKELRERRKQQNKAWGEVEQVWEPLYSKLESTFKDHVHPYLALIYLSPLLLVYSTDLGLTAMLHMWYMQHLYGCPTPLSHMLAVCAYLLLRSLELTYRVCQGGLEALVSLACFVGLGYSEGWYGALLAAIVFGGVLSLIDRFWAMPKAQRRDLVFQSLFMVLGLLYLVYTDKRRGKWRGW